MMAANHYHDEGSSIPSSSSSIISRTLRFLAISLFLVSVAYHSFAGTRYRQNVSAAANRDASLRGKLITTDELTFSFDNDGEEGLVGTIDDTIIVPEYQQHDDTSPSSATSSKRYYKSIFYNAYTSLYKTDNQYSRMLSDTNETEPHTRESEEETEELAHELSIEVSFEDTYKVLVFLGVVFSCGEIASYLGIPSLVGQMIAGFLLGPPLLEFVPYPESFVL